MYSNAGAAKLGPLVVMQTLGLWGRQSLHGKAMEL
jgi:hypothetical protein